MKKYWKAGLLTFTLVGPALVIVFLHLFMENHFTLPNYFPVVDEMGNVKMNKKDTVFLEMPIAFTKNQVIAIINCEATDSTDTQVQYQINRIRKEFEDVLLIEKMDSVSAQAIKSMTSKTFDSKNKLLLIDNKRNVRGIYKNTDPEEIERLRAEIKVLKDIYKKDDGSSEK